MFGLGWGELIVVGIVALIVVGPKELPVMFRTMGRFAGKARGMAREFSRAMEDAADQAGVKDVASDLRAMSNPKKMGLDKLKDAAKDVTEWEAPEPDVKHVPGEHTKALSEERKEAAKKIHDYSAKKAQERLDREAAKEVADAPGEPAPTPAAKDAS